MDTLGKEKALKETYQIIGAIGSGSFGTAYRARHLRLQIDVVIKKLHDDIKSDDLRHREAEILKKLKHPYLPRIYDFIYIEEGENKGVYTVMDYVAGEDLGTVLKKVGSFPEEQVYKWATQLGEALAYLHSQNPPIIHSDIKPTNIMLTESGDICLIDFNVSLALGKEKESAISYAAGYSPPEQYNDLERYMESLQKMTGASLPKKIQAGRDERTVAMRDSDRSTVCQTGRDEATVYQGSLGRDEAMVYQGALGRDEATVYQGALGRDEATVYQGSLGRDEATVYQGALGRDEATVYQGSLGRDEATVYQESLGRDEATVCQTSYKMATITKKVDTRLIERYVGGGIKEYSDIYSLGATLFCMLTGKNVSLEMRRKDIEKALSNCVSESFLQILLTMLEIAPENRYQNGVSLLDALRNSGEDPAAKRKKMLAEIVIVGAIFIVIIITAFMIQRDRRIKSSEYYTLLQQAETEIENRNFARATNLIDNAQVHSKERIDAYEKELYLLYTMEQFDKCVELGQAYINAPVFEIKSDVEKQSYGNIIYTTAKAYHNLAQYEHAMLLYPMALEYVPDNSAYYRDYAICLIKAGKISEAQEQIDKGLELEMKQDSLYMVQGELAFAKMDYQEALSCFIQCYEITDDMDLEKRAVLNYVQACKEQGDTRIVDAIEVLEEYVEKHPGNINLLVMECLADSYIRAASYNEDENIEYYEKALVLFQEVLESGYKTYQIQENIAILYENIGELEDAEEVLIRLSKEYPDKYQVYKRLAYLEADKQQKLEEDDRSYHNMLRYYEQAMQLYSDEIQDMEMQMLQHMIDELENGGWL